MIGRRKPRPRPDEMVLDELDRVVRAEVARRRDALDVALAEMDRPRLTTTTILDGYLARVMAEADL